MPVLPYVVPRTPELRRGRGWFLMDPIADALMDLYPSDDGDMDFVEMTRRALGTPGSRFTRGVWPQGRGISISMQPDPVFVVIGDFERDGGTWIPDVEDILADDWRGF